MAPTATTPTPAPAQPATATAKPLVSKAAQPAGAASVGSALEAPLIELYSAQQANSPEASQQRLRQAIIDGLKGGDNFIIPGDVNSSADRQWAYRRSKAIKMAKTKAAMAYKEKWGDAQVGKHNGGVNAEEGLDGDSAVGPASLIELGAGSLRKTIHLIRALQGLPDAAKVTNENKAGTKQSSASPAVNYYALDLDRSELVRTLGELHDQERGASDTKDKHHFTIYDGAVALNGIWATYDQGLEYVGQGGLAPKQGQKEGQRCFLWLGSSCGNLDRRELADFLHASSEKALRPGDSLLISIDRRNKPEDVAAAYHDANGTTEKFILEGLVHANRVLGKDVFQNGAWRYHDRYNELEGRHESYYQSTKAQTLNVPGEAEAIHIEEGELILVEVSYKHSELEIHDVLDQAGLRVVQRWSTDGDKKYDMWLVERPAFHFPSSHLNTGSRVDQLAGLTAQQAFGARGSWEFDSTGGAGANALKAPHRHARTGLPSIDEWQTMWKAWDTVTLTMIPPKMLFEKPIDLRHICLFYIGHIPAFVDIMVCKVTGEKHIDSHFSCIFERGIDPHMDDESKCNPHSEVPQNDEDWPALDAILAYREKVMERIYGIYGDVATGARSLDRALARTIWMVYEHIALHMETLLYMLMQSPNTLPPAGFTAPDWPSLARQWDAADAAVGGEAARTALLHFKAAPVIIGHDDDDRQDAKFAISKPSKKVEDLNAQLHASFGWDNESPARVMQTGAFAAEAAPISNGQYLKYLQDHKLVGDADAVPSSWIGAGSSSDPFRVRTVYGPVGMSVAHLWPLCASGKQLADYAASKGGRLPTHAELRCFLDASSGPNVTDRPGSNVGYTNWHPVPPQLARQESGIVIPGHNGGVWEWTSSPHVEYEGYKSSLYYTGYSSDFLDGKHDIVLGASWATTPSIAGRRTVINWYQQPYPFIFGGARVVYDDKTEVKASRSRSPPRA
ncbi:hypothetical protein CBOM_03925 [Ceraceosorus bombacis]|uniref:Uncharacterized protein n=1 Tax=Ceraceosorus bombacis TaxID=401625 RepID=A0A0P1BP87_9BASI|nr:hypothetical protein CBOM_03925 [Ceraceosorus bombacis]